MPNPNPNPTLVSKAAGAIQERRGSTDEALDLYARALRSDPRHAPSWVSASLLLQRRRKEGAARRCLDLALACAPRSYYVWQVRWLGEWRCGSGRG